MFLLAVTIFLIGIFLKDLKKLSPAKMFLQPNRIIISRGSIILNVTYDEIKKIRCEEPTNKFIKSVVYKIITNEDIELQIKTSYDIYESLIYIFPNKDY
ncbi:hypothetical protein ULMS_17380 [Patiriisocius marinistellae]|uniref:Uncharacterized protein n=1 Tax=Patiriisocius marinistellae TaxID=2494560 RepID=A0A5J4FVZ0_9FLAO|nr:hypothetical protein ULMS_17380 [Patiriisocius marinistellae]